MISRAIHHSRQVAGKWTACAFAALALSVVAAEPADAVVVRFFTTKGSFNVRLFNGAMPRSTTNFLNYVNGNDYDGTFIHRSAVTNVSGQSVPFVVQGGGYKVPATGLRKPNGQLDFITIPLDPPIADEPGGGVAGPSNVRGTIAMAKGGPDSVTSQFFFNMRDNTGLDDPNRPGDGGFSAFGRVLGTGMAVVDSIAALSRFNVGGQPLTEVPVNNLATVQSQGDVFNKDVVLINDVRRLNIPDGDYNFNGVVNGGDLAVWKANFGSTTNLDADGNGDGVVNGADFFVLQRTMGQNTGAPVGVVPEPASWALGVASAAALCAVRRRLSAR